MSTVSANDRDDLAGEFRRPSKAEDRIIQLLLSSEFPGAPALREQMSKALVRRIDAEGSLEISSGDGPHAAVVRRVPVEAEAEDSDGVTIHVLLHVVDGLMRELEIYLEDSAPVQRTPTPQDLRVLVL